jgi:hypothetical protein
MLPVMLKEKKKEKTLLNEQRKGQNKTERP